MKSIKFLFLSFVVVALFSACEKIENSAPASTITYLPKLTVFGDTDITLPCGTTTYSDEGAIAEEAGQTIDLETTIKPKYFGSTQIDGVDSYNIVYSAENKDGIPGVKSRNVLIPACNGDLVNSIEGMYTAYLSRTTKSSGAVLATPQYQGVGPIIIKSLGGNEYAISDAIGGWYEYGRSLGIDFACIGQTITANNIATNDFTYGPAPEVGYFGGVNTLTSFKVMPAEKKIVFTSDWEAGFDFEVTLIQD